jgi:crotonyl-CoA carboxylase/reductase
VQAQQLMPRPKHLTWEESACYTLTLATAYRMLFGHEPHDLKPGQNVLVWGASGGLGSYAIQLINTAGANAIGVISDEEDKRDFVMGLGAKGVINRKDFKCWGQLPKVNSPEYNDWLKEARRFGKAIWDITGKGVNVDMVFEHPGEATFPVSSLVVQEGRHGRDLRRHHRVQLHLRRALHVDAPEAPAGQPLRASEAGERGEQADAGAPARPLHVRGLPLGRDSGRAHEDAAKNQHKPGNMAVLVQAPRTGLRTFEDTLEASRGARSLITWSWRTLIKVLPPCGYCEDLKVTADITGSILPLGGAVPDHRRRSRLHARGFDAPMTGFSTCFRTCMTMRW